MPSLILTLLFINLYNSMITLTSGTSDSLQCYSDFCHNNNNNNIDNVININNNEKCYLTSIQRGQDCIDIKFHKYGHAPPPGVALIDLKLSAYIVNLPHKKITAFNLTINDIKFKRLLTRYQSLGDTASSHCRDSIFHGFDKYNRDKKNLFISCPFANSSFEDTDYKLEYLVTFNHYKYSRKLVFNVPNHSSIDEHISSVFEYKPFVYIDVSDVSTLSLFIQPMPNKYNITSYKIWMIKYNTNTIIDVVDVILKYNNDNGDNHLQYNFTVSEGIYQFKVASMHPQCGEYGCVNNTLPAISTKYQTKKLFIMIISFVWIPPVLLYAIYYLYSFYKQREIMKKFNQNCLLIYSPTHSAHVNVMISFAKYLKSCGINAMIDVLDIPKTSTRDPAIWCNDAFDKANIILIATSPPPSSSCDNTNSASTIYQNLDNHLLRLVRENYSKNNKKYMKIVFPYCSQNDIPEEARLFKKFTIPDNLDKMIRYIYQSNKLKLFGKSSKDLIANINIAMTEICFKKSTSQINNTETYGLFQGPDDNYQKNYQSGDCNYKKNSNNDYYTSNETLNCQFPQYFSTKIDELNLLGDDSDNYDDNHLKIETIQGHYVALPDNNDKFHIDQLNL
ncbi:hypothetical protein HCN44_001829 [Aphidius gifuensis]|uniref:SEFIR domain-containing protein n=1 Tax=Aphidius gifuensis TaxID=684658 RepID=A0A835CU96_APHGI|nr:uncharacterized protein LOC122861056 [Aphidius gifuensis]KAF7996197.1 hypothetical protein HCN44_001829 [Aphidius gifuensis]